MIFGVLNPEKIWHQYVVHLLTSPVYCSHFTLVSPKKSFFDSIIHTYLRLFTLSQKRTNCYLLTHHTCKMSLHCLLKCKTFSPTGGNVAFHHAVLKLSPCRNKMLSQLVHIADWYSIHALLQYSNLAVPTSSSLSLEQKSTGSVTETCCWCRSCYTSDPQHYWRRVCLPARQCASTSCSWHSRASVPWDTPVPQSW